jgi:nicotinate-nucleotide adenylyltransferase
MAGKTVKKRIGLFFGSFNPVHVGHMIIANFMATQTDLDQVWLVVSPQNPLKPKNSLARDYDRLHLVRLAIGENPQLRASDIEFSLPKPSYTIDTLTYLKEKYPEYEFILIMGGDNLASLHRWKNYELLLKNHQIFVYSRPGYEIPENFRDHRQVLFFEAPQMHISASYIRQSIKQGHSVQYLLTEPVYQYLESSTLYRN